MIWLFPWFYSVVGFPLRPDGVNLGLQCVCMYIVLPFSTLALLCFDLLLYFCPFQGRTAGGLSPITVVLLMGYLVPGWLGSTTKYIAWSSTNYYDVTARV